MTVRKWMGDLVSQFPNIKLADEVSESNLGCTECKHTMYIPCFDHPYCINPESDYYGCHYHSWDVACEKYEEGERYKEFDCPFYDGQGDCDDDKRGDKPCPYDAFN